MYCKKCGENIEEDSIFCRYCGVDVKSSLYNEEETKADQYHEHNNSEQSIDVCESVELVASKEKSMKWYKVLVYYFMPASIILSPINVLGNLYITADQYYGGLKEYFINPADGLSNILYMVVYIAIMVLLIYADTEAKKMTVLGYKLILIFFIVSMIYPVFEVLIYLPVYEKANIDFNFNPAIGRLIFNILYGVPNIIYFKKRKHLFCR